MQPNEKFSQVRLAVIHYYCAAAGCYNFASVAGLLCASCSLIAANGIPVLRKPEYAWMQEGVGLNQNIPQQRVGVPTNIKITPALAANMPGMIMTAGKTPLAGMGGIQQFPTGATRSTDAGKNDYDGFLSPIAIDTYGNYMTKHRIQVDGSLRDSSNWRKGMPIVGSGSYMKALLRHTLELWGLTLGYVSTRLKTEMPGASIQDMIVESSCAIYFNIQGFLHEYVKQGHPELAA